MTCPITEQLQRANFPPSHQSDSVTGDVSSRFSVKCTPEAISGRSAGSDLPQRKSGLQESTGIDFQTLSEFPTTRSRDWDTWFAMIVPTFDDKLKKDWSVREGHFSFVYNKKK